MYQIDYLKPMNGIFERFLVSPKVEVWPFTFEVPEGYELKETKEHKLTRLKEEIASKKQTQELYQKQLLLLSKQIDDLEKELKEIE